MLELQALELERGGYRLFQPLDLQVCAGETVAIEAGNGVGKTTLLRCIAGLVEAAEGALRRPSLASTGHAAVVRLLAHQLAIKGLLTVLENLHFWAMLDGGHADTARILALLEAHGLAGYEWQAGHTLSAGQRKRVALTRLVLNPGELWLLDEPFANLDSAGIDLVAQRIREHSARGGAVVLTAHGPLPVDLAVRRVRLEPMP